MGTRNYGLVESVDELSRFCDRLLAGDGPFGFDIETGYLGADTEKGSLRVETNILVGISFTNSLHWARYVPLRHDTADGNLDNYAAARLLWVLLASGRGVAHNATFELRNLARFFREQLWDDPDHGEAVRAADGYFPIRSDTLIEAYLVAEQQQFGLKALTKLLFGHTMTELHELFPGLAQNKRKFMRFNILDLTPQVVEYACEDSVWCLAIHLQYHEAVKDRLLYRVEHGVLACVCEMEDYGVRYDWGYLRRGAEALREFQSKFNAEIMTELTDMLGTTTAINLASPAQVSGVLYGKLGLRTSVYTASTKDKPRAQRKMSTGAIALAGLSRQYPVVKKVLQWKEMTKLLGTYLDKYERVYGTAPDGMTHPNHLSAFVVTGRFAVSDPPYQQSPKKYHFDLAPAREAHARHAGEHGGKCDCDDPAFAPPAGTCFRFNFRDAVTAPPEHYILGFDLSQAELRAIAGEAQETALLRAFEAGEDVHTLTASLMLGIPLDEVTSEQRGVGKTMNFALLYGMGVKSLADRLGIPVEEAQALYDQYFHAYPNIAVWSDKQVAFGKTHGYVTSKFGRRLPIWEFQSDKHWIYTKGERACVNYPIQGAATGDLMKIAMVRARTAIRDAGLADRVHLVMNIHDALEFYIHVSVLPEDVIGLLQKAVIFPVPGWPKMAADWHIAKKWGSPMEVELREDGRLIVKGKKEIEIVPSVEADEETGEEIEVLPEVDLGTLRAAAHTRPGGQVGVHDCGPRSVGGPDRCGLCGRPFDDTDLSGGELSGGGELSVGGRRVIVCLDDMPEAAGYRRFLDLLAARPGANSLTLRTPQGELPLECGGTDLSPADVAAVSLVLGAAKIFYDASDVDADELVKGLTL